MKILEPNPFWFNRLILRLQKWEEKQYMKSIINRSGESHAASTRYLN
jgi:hypothetical protein